MLKNLLKLTIRNLLDKRKTAILNITGLALSMSVCLVIMVIIMDQNSYDKFNTKANRIYRITTINTLKYNRSIDRFATTIYPLAEELMTKYTVLDDAVVLNRLFLGLGMYKGINVQIYGLYASSSFFNVFDFKLEKGYPEAALVEPYSIVLKEDVARNFFGSEEPMGKIFEVENLGQFQVTGILKKTDDKSHIQFEAIASASTINLMETSGKIEETTANWNNYFNSYVYVLIKKGLTSNVLQEILNIISNNKYYNNDSIKLKFILQPLLNIVPGPLLRAEYGYFLRTPIIIFFICLGLIIIITGVFNYTSISIALAVNRAKEIGIKKTVGASRKHIIIQFIFESIVVAIISLLLAIVILQLLLPLFSMMEIINPRQMIINYIWFFVFAIIIGLLSSLLPALFMSSFNPILIVRSKGDITISGKLTLRKILLFFQLSVSMVFMVSVIIFYNQLKYMMNVNRGFDEELVYNIELHGNDFNKIRDLYIQEAGVEIISASSQIPGMDITSTTKVKLSAGDENIKINDFSVDKNYIDAMGLKLIAGSTFLFDPGYSNEQQIVVSESFLKKFELGDPVDAVGTAVILDDSMQVSISGIIKDYKYGDLMMYATGPLIFRNQSSKFKYAVLRINPVNLESLENRLNKIWEELDQNHEFNGELLSERLKFFLLRQAGFTNILYIIGFITILSAIIALLGLIGMISINIQKRKKEISIRKVFGSKSNEIIKYFSKSYFMILILSGLFAALLAYFINNLWLQKFAYHISIGYGSIAIGILIIFIISLLIVYQKTRNAANINPAEQLREE